MNIRQIIFTLLIKPKLKNNKFIKPKINFKT